jgi:ESCRT-II complex subunit VPS22
MHHAARSVSSVHHHSSFLTSLQSSISCFCFHRQLEIKLTDFAKKHRHEIQHDPAIRQRFLEMCAPLGIDPLLSKKTFLGNLLGMSDFYYELAVKVAEVCLASRTRNGGIISIQEVRDILQKRKSKFHLSGGQTTQSYSHQDIQTAISKLSHLGGGFRTVQVGKATMIVSVPTELDNDHMVIMGLAQEEGGCVSLHQAQQATKWSSERAKRALDLLLGEGMAWLDVYRGESFYWFPRFVQYEDLPCV